MKGTKTKPGPCQVCSETDDCCPRLAVAKVRGIPFCEPCAREQEAYFAVERVLGFSRTRDDDPDGELKARFVTSQLKTNAPLQEIRSKVGEIRKYIVNSTVEIPQHDHRGPLHRFLESAMPFARRDRTEDIQKNFRMELDWEPDKETLQQAIDDWNRHEAGDNYWVGVKFKNDGRIHRFDEALGRSSVELTGGLGE